MDDEGIWYYDAGLNSAVVGGGHGGVPNEVAVGPDGDVWLSVTHPNLIRHIGVSGPTVTDYDLSTTGSSHGPARIVSAINDGAVWFVCIAGPLPQYIGRVSTAGTLPGLAAITP